MTSLQKTQLTLGIALLLSLGAYALLHIWQPLVVPALIGIGLIRAGITGTCPLESLFAKNNSVSR